MAFKLPYWILPISEAIINSLDRRIPAVLFREGLDRYKKESDDIYSEVYYTASIWNIFYQRIWEHRM